MELVIRNYWWLGIINDIERYIDGYDMYQKMKSHIETLVGKLMVNKVLERP